MKRLRLLGLLAVLCLAAACSSGMPEGVTKQGREIKNLYVFILVLALIVFFAVEAAIVWCVLRYRRRPGDDDLPVQTHGHFGVEILWTAIPTVIVVFLFAFSLQTLDRVDAKEAAPSVTVDVTGFQWQWTFKYQAPDEGVTIRGSTENPPEMVLPVNEATRINLKAADVMHSFYVPDFNFKRDLIPGFDNAFDFTPLEKGIFRGQCAEFCGLLHNKMTFSVRIVDRPEFDAFVIEQRRLAEEAIRQCGDPSETVVIAANNIAFDDACFAVPADTPFAIDFDNQEPQPHNVAIYEDETANPPPLAATDIITGPQRRTFTSTPGPPPPEEPYTLPEGQFFFRCDVHPIMQGTVISR